jgi:phosphonopyruvate decarboxylase
MRQSLAFAEFLRGFGFTFYTGVPDSVLRGLCAALDLRNDICHVPAVNEGAAIGLAIGWHIASGEVPVIYLQNSGLWNALNPFFSLAHPSVYDIPLLFIVGWRGRPGFSDEPQHLGTGSQTETALRMMGVSYLLIEKWDEETERLCTQHLTEACSNGRSAALLIASGVLDQKISASTLIQSEEIPRRSELMDVILRYVGPDDLVVAGIGHTGRELYSSRMRCTRESAPLRDFLCVGGMGFALQVALAAALRRPNYPVWCIEGDGSFLMHLGTAGVVSALHDLPVTYVLLDNGAHASVGGQRTACKALDYGVAASALGFRTVERAHSVAEVGETLERLLLLPGPRFLWVKIRNEPDAKLPRPEESLLDRKDAIMDFLVGARASCVD